MYYSLLFMVFVYVLFVYLGRLCVERLSRAKLKESNHYFHITNGEYVLLMICVFTPVLQFVVVLSNIEHLVPWENKIVQWFRSTKEFRK